MSTTEITESDVIRFTDPHHAMNGSLINHEGDLGVVVDINRGYDGEKVVVRFLEGSSKKVTDEWAIHEDRVTLAEDGPWEFKCGMCGHVFETENPDRCPQCVLTSIKLVK